MSTFDYGLQAGMEQTALQNQRKQQKSDLEFQTNLGTLLSNRNAIQTKLPTLLSPKGEKTPEYNQAMEDLTKNEASLRELFHPAKSPPGALSKFGHLLTNALHITKPEATMTMAIAKPHGLVEPGNINIWSRPVVQNVDGSHSTEYSVSFQDKNGNEVLVPTVVNGKFLTPDGKKPPEGSPAEKAMFKAAWDHYLKTGEHLGKFKNSDAANAYAVSLHSRGEMPKNIAKLQEEQKRNNAADQAAAQAVAAAAEEAPGLKAARESEIQAQQDMAKFRSKMKQLKELFPDADEEQQRQWANELAANITGVKAVPQKYFSSLATTKDDQGKEHYWRVPMMPDEPPEEVDFNGQAMVPKQPAGANKPVRAWTKDANGKTYSVLLDPKTNQSIPGTENYDILPPAYMTTRISTGIYHWTDENNAIHATPETHTTKPVLQTARTPAQNAPGAPSAVPGAPGVAQPPATSPAKAAPRVAQPGTPQSRQGIKDNILGYKGSAPLNHARQLYSDASRQANLADRLAARAQTNPNDMAEADTQFVLSLIRSEAGRVNQQEIAMLFNAGGIAESPYRWVSKVGHGQLTPRLRQQLIDYTHDLKESAADAVKELEHGGGGAETPEQIKNEANKKMWPGAQDIGSTYLDEESGITYSYIGGDPLKDTSWKEVKK